MEVEELIALRKGRTFGSQKNEDVLIALSIGLVGLLLLSLVATLVLLMATVAAH